jgi:carboxymethylenebutenolidase
MKSISSSITFVIVFILILVSALGCGQKASAPSNTETATTAESTATAPSTPSETQSTTSTSSASPSETTTSPTITATMTPSQTASTPTTTTTYSFVPIVWTSPSSPIILTIDETTKRATYQSGGDQISAYFYKPIGTGPFPAILMLHGRDGLQEYQRSYASWLAARGYVVLAPDYLTPVGVSPQTWSGADYSKHTERIREIQADGLEDLKSLDYVDSNRLGIIGFSLGGYYSFILATRDDIKSIVSYYGAYFITAPYKPENDRFAEYKFIDIVTQIKTPVLMFHGNIDALVAISTADAAHGLLDTANKPNEYYVYPGVGHAFNIQGSSTYDAQATTDAEQKVINFLETNLK